jgi:hypothetical protein
MKLSNVIGVYKDLVVETENLETMVQGDLDVLKGSVDGEGEVP